MEQHKGREALRCGRKPALHEAIRVFSLPERACWYYEEACHACLLCALILHLSITDYALSAVLLRAKCLLPCSGRFSGTSVSGVALFPWKRNDSFLRLTPTYAYDSAALLRAKVQLNHGITPDSS